MLFYDALLVILGLKKKTVPVRDNWVAYADFKKANALKLYSDANFLLLFFIVLSYFMPVFLLAAGFCIYFRFYKRLFKEIDYRNDKDFLPYMVVNCIQQHHNQSLKEHFLTDPGLIDCVYKNKSLLHWSKEYKNYEAHKMILALMKERSKR